MVDVEKDHPAIPMGPDGLTPEFLTEILRARAVLRNGSVVSCDSDPMDVSSFTGQFQRLRLRYDTDEPEAPRRLIAKFSAKDHAVRAMIHSMGFYAREAAFYERLAPRSPVRVPTCYYAAVDSNDGRSLFLLEDLTTARPGRSSGRCSLADAEMAIDAAARLHARWWQSPQLNQLPWLNPQTLAPIDRAQDWFTTSWAAFLDKLSIPITETIRHAANWISDQLTPTMQQLLHEPPRTLMHYDYQADNILFDIQGDVQSLAIIDWQMHIRGRGPIDLAFFLSGSLDSQLRRQHEYDLLSRYADQLKANGVQNYDLAQCMNDYRLALILPPARLAVAIASNTQLTPHDGAYWDVLFDRQTQALHDNRP